jgi:hypothetical protein
MMKKILLALALPLMLFGNLAAQVLIGMTIGTGYSQTPSAKFAQWAKSQEVNNAVSRADNVMITFDMIFAVNKIRFGVNYDWDLGSANYARPRTSLLHFAAGYRLYGSPRIDVFANGSLGIGSNQVTFKSDIPRDFRRVYQPGYFATQLLFVGQPSLILHYKPKSKRFIEYGEKEYEGWFFTLKSGFNFRLAEGHWYYGEVYRRGKSQSFRGYEVNMPDFFEKSFFVQMTLGFAFEGIW